MDWSKNPNMIVKDTLTADVVMTPNYSLNESDFGDATAMPVWDFDKPDSVVLFRNFQGKCSFVKPTFFDSNFVDLNMLCDATYGWIDNENGQELGYADVGAGTKFTLPARYGTIYRMVTKEALSATTIADSTNAQYKTTKDAKGNLFLPCSIMCQTRIPFRLTSKKTLNPCLFLPLILVVTIS